MRTGIAESLERGQTLGTVRADISPEAPATLIVSTIEGLASTAKSTRNRSLVLTAAAVLMQFLESLRPVAASTAVPQTTLFGTTRAKGESRCFSNLSPQRS